VAAKEKNTMFSDVEIGLAARHRADLRAYAREAQTIVDQKNSELGLAYAEIKRLQGELGIEKAKRQSLALKLDRARR